MQTFILAAILASFQIGPTIGAFVPVQDEDDPWGASFLFGVAARYGIGFADLEAGLQFTELSIDPDSSRGFDYSLIPLTLGLGRELVGVRTGIGVALYTIEAKQQLDEELTAVWKGTYPGMYLSLGKDLSILPGTVWLDARFNIIDFDGLWIGLTGTYFF